MVSGRANVRLGGPKDEDEEEEEEESLSGRI